MIARLLARLESNPNALFEERELCQWDADMFGRLKDQRLLHRMPVVALEGEVIWRGNRSFVVLETGGRLSAVAEDEDDPEVISELDVAELTLWKVDVVCLARKIADANGLSGDSEALGPRLTLLGAESAGDRGYVLAFFSNDQDAAEGIRTLSRRMVTPSAGVTLACPSYRASVDVASMAESGDLQFGTFDPASLEIVRAPGIPDEDAFWHNAEFTHIRARGREFRLTPRRASVVRVIYRAKQNRRTPVGLDYIKSQLDDLFVDKLRDVFKDSDAWGDLVTRDTRGLYDLDI